MFGYWKPNLPGNLLNSNAPFYRSDQQSYHNHPEPAVHPSSEKVEAVGNAEVGQGLVEEQQGAGGACDHHGLTS